MSDVTERIVRRAKHLKLKQIDIVNFTKASAATVNKWFNHLNDPSSKYIEDLAKALSVSVNWILTGEDNKEIKSNVEELKEGKLRRIPVLNWVQAGEFSDVCDNVYDDFEYIYDDGKLGNHIYAARVRGDSMEPLFFENDLLIINQERKARAGDYVIAVVEHDNQATFKRFKPCGLDPKTKEEFFQLVPLNDFYPVVDSRFTGFSIRGVVIKHERCLV